MTSKIKALGLAVVAIAAMSVFAMPAAQAAKLDIGATPASVFAQTEANQAASFTLTSAGGSKFAISCPMATLEGTTQGQSIEEATFTPTFSGNAQTPNCTAFGVAAQVLMNGCKFTFTASGQPSGTLLIDIVGCTTGTLVEIKTAICKLDVLPQNGLSHIVGSKLSSQEATLSASVSNITVLQTGAACPDGNNHHSSSLSAILNAIMRAYLDSGGTQVTKHSHQYQELAQTGARTTIELT